MNSSSFRFFLAQFPSFSIKSIIKSGRSTTKSTVHPQFIHRISRIFHQIQQIYPPNLSTSHVHSRLKEDIWDVLPEIQDVTTAKVAVKQALAPLQEAGLCGFSSSINGISWDIIHGIYNMDISMIMGKSSIYPWYHGIWLIWLIEWLIEWLIMVY